MLFTVSNIFIPLWLVSFGFGIWLCRDNKIFQSFLTCNHDFAHNFSEEEAIELFGKDDVET